jgi:hypothetical protein
MGGQKTKKAKPCARSFAWEDVTKSVAECKGNFAVVSCTLHLGWVIRYVGLWDRVISDAGL